MPTWLMCDGKKLLGCVQVIPDHISEKITKIDAHLTRLSLKMFNL